MTHLGIEVITGDTYEPRSISQKVMDRLEDELDFIGGDGESPWTPDEIATAKHRKIPLVPIVQDGVRFDSGIINTPRPQSDPRPGGKM
jgi:hypothetical protein